MFGKYFYGNEISQYGQEKAELVIDNLWMDFVSKTSTVLSAFLLDKCHLHMLN